MGVLLLIEGLAAVFGAGWLAHLLQQSPSFDPGSIFTRLIAEFAKLAVPIGAFVLLLMIITELFNDRRDMRKIVLEGVGIVVLVILMMNSTQVLQWLMNAAGA